MADISRRIEGYKLPAVVRQKSPSESLGTPFTLREGTPVEGTTTFTFGLRTGKVIQQVSDPGVEVATKLKSVTLTIENTNRSVGNSSDMTFTVLLPGDATVEATPYFGDVNAWIAAEILAGGTEMEELDTNGITVGYRGNEIEGNLTVTIPGADADAAGPVGGILAADDTAVPYLPAGQWFVNVVLVAWDETDNYYWGDADGIVDLINGQDETDFDGLAGNGTFEGGLGHAGTDVVTLSDGSTVTIDTVTAAVAGTQTVDVGGAVAGGTATGLNDADTQGYDEVSFAPVPLSTDVPGLAADDYDFDVDIDTDGGATYVITIAGTETYAEIAALMDAELTGASASFEAVNGAFRVTSDSFGTVSKIILTEGTGGDAHLFGSIETAETSVATPEAAVDGTTTTYTAAIVVDGGGSEPISVDGQDADTYTNLISELDTDTTATWSIVGGNLVATSPTTGLTSTIVITDTDLFAALTQFVGINAPVDGTAGIVTEFTILAFGAGDAFGTLTQTGTDGSGTGFTLTPGANNVAGGSDVLRQLRYFVPEYRDYDGDGINDRVMVVARAANTTDGFDYAAPFKELRPEGALLIDDEGVEDGVIGGSPANTGDAAVALAQAVSGVGSLVKAIRPGPLVGQVLTVLPAEPTYTGYNGETVIVEEPGGANSICTYSEDDAGWNCAVQT